ncbi:MAG: hypothetical protein LC798_19080 [Chloroflexi bacterium]|nr:hypothetical protein [Chloroflexota bacterium]
MAYSTPQTWSPQQRPTAAQLNQDLRDNVSFLANPPACRVYHSTTQNVTTGGGGATLLCDTEDYDTAGMHSTSVNTQRITITTAGLYVITAAVKWSANATSFRVIDLYKNGSNSNVSVVQMNAGAATTNQILTSQRKLAVNDYLHLQAYQESGSTLTATVYEFAATRLGIG